MKRSFLVSAVAVFGLLLTACAPSTPPPASTERVLLAWIVRPTDRVIDDNQLTVPTLYVVSPSDVEALKAASGQQQQCTGVLEFDLAQFDQSGCIGGPKGAALVSTVLSRTEAVDATRVAIKRTNLGKGTGTGGIPQLPGDVDPGNYYPRLSYVLLPAARGIASYLNLTGAPEPRRRAAPPPADGCAVPAGCAEPGGADFDFKVVNGSPNGRGKRWTNTCNPSADYFSGSWDSLTEIPASAVVSGVISPSQVAFATTLVDSENAYCTN